jgi:hypothetical protein
VRAIITRMRHQLSQSLTRKNRGRRCHIAEPPSALRNLSLAAASTFTGAKPNFVSRSLIGEPKVASTEQRIPTITLVVYKVDRLTRSLADFAKLVEMGDSARRARLCVKRRFSDNEPCSFASSDAAALIVSGGSLRGDRSRSLRQLPISRDGRQSARQCRQSRRL